MSGRERKPSTALDGVMQLLRQRQQLLDMADPPASRAIREAIEAATAYSGILGSFERISATAELAAARASLFGIPPRIAGLSESPLIGMMSEAARAAEGYSLALGAVRGLTGMTDVMRSAHLFDVGGGLLETALRRVNLDRSADNVRISDAGISKLTARAESVEWRFGRPVLDAGVGVLESEYFDEPAELLSIVPNEVFRTLDADVAVSEGPDASVEEERQHLADDAATDLDALVQNLGRELFNMLAGARNAARSQQPDSVRHMFVSLRELLGHTLRMLSPDKEIHAWSQETSHFHNGSPTRRARLLYLYETVHSRALREFVEADIKAALQMFDLLNSGTHAQQIAIQPTACVKWTPIFGP